MWEKCLGKIRTSENSLLNWFQRRLKGRLIHHERQFDTTAKILLAKTRKGNGFCRSRINSMFLLVWCDGRSTFPKFWRYKENISKMHCKSCFVRKVFVVPDFRHYLTHARRQRITPYRVAFKYSFFLSSTIFFAAHLHYHNRSALSLFERDGGRWKLRRQQKGDAGCN